jgi:hypothetical protein
MHGLLHLTLAMPATHSSQGRRDDQAEIARDPNTIHGFQQQHADLALCRGGNGRCLPPGAGRGGDLPSGGHNWLEPELPHRLAGRENLQSWRQSRYKKDTFNLFQTFSVTSPYKPMIHEGTQYKKTSPYK